MDRSHPDHDDLIRDGGDPNYVPQPEDFDPTPPRPPGPLQRLPGSASLGWPVTIAGLCLALSQASWQGRLTVDLAASRASVFEGGHYWQLVTALFLHADFVHLGHNLPLLILFGWLLRAFFGTLAFPILSLCIGVLSNACTLWFYAPNIRLMGASGMIYGMISMWLVLYLRFERYEPLRKRVMRAVGFALLMLFPKSYEPGTSYLAHATGFVAGLPIGAVLAYLIRERSDGTFGLRGT